MEEGGMLEMYGLYGKKVKRKQIPSGSNEIKININDLKTCLYLVKVSDRSGNPLTSKVITK